MTLEEKRIKAVNVIRYYNKLTGKATKIRDEVIDLILETVDAEDKDKLMELRIFMDRNVNKDTTESITEIIENFAKTKFLEEKEKKENVANNQSEAQASLSVLEQALAKVFLESKKDVIEKEFVNKCLDIAKDKIAEEYGSIKKSTTLKIDEKEIKFEGEVLHHKFEEVLKFVASNEPVFLTGEAGTGKNFLCKQIAKALNLDFYFSNAVSQEYKITGFTDAMGKYQETQFYKAFKNGGLFMLDEMDASIPEVLVILNSAIANRYFDFPAPIGYVEAHKDFRVIAAGNTFGEGASYQYVGRNQLDGASLDRFACVNITYDREIEKAISNGNEELINYITELRKTCKLTNIQLIVSYRAVDRITKMENQIGLVETLNTCLFKNTNERELSSIISNFNGDKNNKYFHAMVALKDSKGD